jgi:hypothetical protein
VQVSETIVDSTTPWQLLVYVLATGKLGQVFDKEAIARMICPNKPDITSARQRVDLAFSSLGLTAA